MAHRCKKNLPSNRELLIRSRLLVEAKGRHEWSTIPMTAGLLRESVLLRYAQCCHLVRGRLLIRFLHQSVNTQDLDSGGRGRKFKSSHPDHQFHFNFNPLGVPPQSTAFSPDFLCPTFALYLQARLSELLLGAIHRPFSLPRLIGSALTHCNAT